jgi:hypothetical protein
MLRKFLGAVWNNSAPHYSLILLIYQMNKVAILQHSLLYVKYQQVKEHVIWSFIQQISSYWMEYNWA